MTRERSTFIIIFLFVIFSLLISAYTLFQQSLRLDEAQSLWVATKSIPGIISYISLDVTVPLYELILHFWIEAFGISIFSARLLSFIFFLFTIPVLYLVAKKSSDTRIALLTIALYSLSPFIIWYSFEIRMYTIVTFMAVLSHYFFLKMIHTGGKRGQVGYFFSILLGLFTHYFFIFLIMAQGIFFLYWFIRRFNHVGSFRDYVKWNFGIIKNFLTPVFLAALFFLPWVIFFLLQGGAANTQPLIPATTPYDIFQTLVNFLFGFQSTSLQSFLVSLWPLSVIPIFFLFSKRKSDIEIENILYFLLTVMIPIGLVFVVSIFFKPIFLTRYLIFVTPSFFILLAWTLFHISKQLSALVLMVFALAMFGFLIFQNISNSTPVKEDYQGVALYLDKNAKPDDIIAITSPFTIYPFEYYYKGSASIVTIPLWNVYKSGRIPSYSTVSLAAQVKNYTKNYGDLYVIFSYNQGYENSIKNYLDTHYQRLLIKDFSPGLELREYKLRYP